MAVLGDSSAVGLGVELPSETPGALLARGLAAAARRPVAMTCVGQVGAESSDLREQVDRALPLSPELAVIMVGANDVTHKVRPSEAVRHLVEAVRRLIEIDCAVVVATCPDLGTIEPLAQPLRSVARRWSRMLAAAQTIAVVEAGGRTVSLGDILGPEFAADRQLFSADRFHPSAAGYARAAAAMLPSIIDAVGIPHADRPEPARRRRPAGRPRRGRSGGRGRYGGRRHRARRLGPRPSRTLGVPPPAPPERARLEAAEDESVDPSRRRGARPTRGPV